MSETLVSHTKVSHNKILFAKIVHFRNTGLFTRRRTLKRSHYSFSILLTQDTGTYRPSK